MAEVLGMNIVEVRNRAKKARTEAGHFRSQIKTADGKVRAVDWRGKDHDRYLGDWQQVNRSIQSASEALEAIASMLEREADAQEQAANS